SVLTTVPRTQWLLDCGDMFLLQLKPIPTNSKAHGTKSRSTITTDEQKEDKRLTRNIITIWLSLLVNCRLGALSLILRQLLSSRRFEKRGSLWFEKPTMTCLRGSGTWPQH